MWSSPGMQDSPASGGFGDRIKGFFGGEENPTGSTEETQGLLSGVSDYAQKAQKSMKGVAERAGGAIGGQVGAAMQVATIGKQQWITFFILMIFGGLLMAASFASLPFLVLAPQKFAIVFTTGNICILAALASLKGVSNFSSHLASRGSLSTSYLGAMAGTLWASLWYHSSLLTIAFSCAQVSGLLWFFVSYIPGGSYTLQIVSDFFWGAMRTMCCRCCGPRTSLPL
eukprot:TRINITY_DN70420_c0_g1_i1.p1 TRINITY_DN70420_c0_g1~~TRINITY_DN70420_c0_g1_i1.p1  ORF type:complete len:227 (-),score=21.69 TRINITY_DN70420_c0_g1_i1:118-798(-)